VALKLTSNSPFHRWLIVVWPHVSSCWSGRSIG
jgi:hypothetical protein